MAVEYNDSSINIEIIRGDTLIVGFNFDNQDEPTRDYTGTTILFQVKADTEDTVAVLQATPSPTIPALAQMEIDIEIDGADTANVEPGEYFYDIQFSMSDGLIRTYISGKFIVHADVSR